MNKVLLIYTGGTIGMKEDPIDQTLKPFDFGGLMEEVPEFHLALAPEGSRSLVKRWKSGYHLIAKETGATVYMGYYDWGRKRISVGERLELTDDPKADMQRIYDHYRPMGIQGFHKDQFAVPDKS